MFNFTDVRNKFCWKTLTSPVYHSRFLASGRTEMDRIRFTGYNSLFLLNSLHFISPLLSCGGISDVVIYRHAALGLRRSNNLKLQGPSSQNLSMPDVNY